MSKISVIIPVYNTKPEYVQVAVDSVLNQTLKEIEIVIVNDGSTDKNTLNFLKNYKNPQIRIINQKNLGLGGARNTGIKYATGKYIGFLDSDDWVDPKFYEKLYNACKQNEADIACGTLSILYQDGTVQNLDKYKNKTTRNNLTKIKYITNGSVCSKLFKKSLFDKLQFAEHLYYEDNPVLLQTLLTASRVTYVPSVHYWYRQHENSIVHDECLAQKRRNDTFIILAEIHNIVKKYPYRVRYAAESCFSKILLYVSHYNKNKEYKNNVNNILNKHKILLCVNHMIMGGAEKILCEYIKVLKPHYQVTVASRKKIYEQYFINFFKQNDICLIDNFVFDKKQNFIQKIIRKIRLKKLFYTQDAIIDFVNCSWYSELRSIPKPKIAWCHGSSLFFETGIGINKIHDYDKFICLTKSFEADFIKKYPEYKNKINHLYNPVNFNDVIISSEQKIDIHKPYFVVVNRLDSGDKDTETIIRAFNIFNKSHKKINLYIIGDGPHRVQLEEIAKNNKNIIFMGQQNNPYPFIKNAEALFLSSTTKIGEGLPTVLIEGQILNTLVVSSDVKNGPREILMDGSAGILFNPQNVQELSKIMSDIHNKNINITEYKQMATKNLDRFMPNNQIIDIINSMLVNKTISVIIPCYNVSQYIARCIESLMRQTLPNLEFLFVDDASTDNTADIIESYANQDSRIKLIRLQKNYGPGYARNVGFKNATGEYVSFIDPDDYLDYDFYDVLYNVAKKYNIPDVVKAKLYIDNDAAGSQLNTMINNNHLYFCKEHTTAIYKRDFLLKNNIFYPEDILTGQDACFVSNIVLHTNNIKTTDNTCYHYVRHNGSMDSNELSHDKVLSRLKMLDYKVDLLNKNIFNNDADKQIFIVEHIKNHFIYLYNADKQEQKSQPLIEKWKQNHLDIFNE